MESIKRWAGKREEHEGLRDSWLYSKIISLFRDLSNGFKFGMGMVAAFVTAGLLAVAVTGVMNSFSSAELCGLISLSVVIFYNAQHAQIIILKTKIMPTAKYVSKVSIVSLFPTKQKNAFLYLVNLIRWVNYQKGDNLFMSRSKSNSDFGELILWGFVGYGLYKLFGNNTPLVGQESKTIPVTSKEIEEEMKRLDQSQIKTDPETHIKYWRTSDGFYKTEYGAILPIEPLVNKGRGFLVPSSVNQGGKHLGVDISTLQYPFGQVELKSPADGHVVAVDVGKNNHAGTPGPGNYVMIKYQDGKIGFFLHLSLVNEKFHSLAESKKSKNNQRFGVLTAKEIDSLKGIPIKKGEWFGVTGETGNAIGAHLHYEMYEKTVTGYRLINPLKSKL